MDTKIHPSCRPIRIWWSRSETWSACTSTRRSTWQCSRWATNRRSRRSIGPPPGCRCCPRHQRSHPLLPGQRHRGPLRRVGDRHRQSRHRHPIPSHQHRLGGLFEQDRPGQPRRAGHTRRLGQPLRPQDPDVAKWLLRHRRFHLHFTPTYGSWMNLVERWFSALTIKKLQRSAHPAPKNWPPTSSPGPTPGTTIPARSYGTRPPNRSSNAWSNTAAPSTRRSQREPGHITADQAKRSRKPQFVLYLATHHQRIM